LRSRLRVRGQWRDSDGPHLPEADESHDGSMKEGFLKEEQVMNVEADLLKP
jgi:hypothetical protein